MGILYIVATPIGNMEDITVRAVKTLFTVDYIACEDTRRTGQLLGNLRSRYTSIIQIIKVQNPKLISYYDEVEFKKIPEIIGLLQMDKNVALVSDSGTPLISDPGFKLVQECIKRGIKVISIPGPTSVIDALVLSGLPPNDFRFIGYLPPSKSHRQKLLQSIQSDMRSHKQLYTIIAFETSHRLKESLEDIKETFGDIEIVFARELTKIHEEILRGPISTLIRITDNIKGEIIILFKAEF